MLSELRSPVLRKAFVKFHDGLNVVLGDENATNSIGKSTLLMLVDFALGGSTLLKHNTDLVAELGHHDYHICHEFLGQSTWFRRGTAEPDVVYACDNSLEPVRALELEEYRAFLSQSYSLEVDGLSFRAVVGLYLRVWGKENLVVDRPLHEAAARSASECVDTLLKLFGRYGPIREGAEALDAAQEERSTLRRAAKLHLMPRVAKKDYKASKQRLASLEHELHDIKVNLAKYATSLSEIVNRDMLALKAQRDSLIHSRFSLTSRLQRVERSLADSKYVKSKHFADLQRFFPELKSDLLAEVEAFHDGVARLLKAELQDSAKALRAHLSSLDSSLEDIDSKMSLALKSVDEPPALVDKVVAVAQGIHDENEKTATYEKDQSLSASIARLKESLFEVRQKALSHVGKVVNDGMRRTVSAVFGPDRKSPTLSLEDSSYTFQVHEDTGTGTAYSSMIIYDLTVFANTPLPVIAHDSLLFKNIETDSVAKLLPVYQRIQKQSFIAIDEADKYGPQTASLLRQLSVIQLDNVNLLFTKDWRA